LEVAATSKAGTKAPASMLIDVGRYVDAYVNRKPDVANPLELVSFGTSGHRGTSVSGTFNESHVLAITQAICEYRKQQGYSGPVYVGKDTHALSEPAQQNAIEVLAANGIDAIIHREGKVTPTPVISKLILDHNRSGERGIADGIVITPSHNPPEDGGFKYNPPNGGPADTDVTDWIQRRANAILADDGTDVRRMPYQRAISSEFIKDEDFISPYVDDLKSVLNIEAIRESGISLGVDPMGGASVEFWEAIAERHRLNLEVVNKVIDPTFSFMTLDHDGKIRMDCSSPYAMANLLALKDRFRLAFGNDPDSDRHGVVTPGKGLLNPNHYLSAAIDYLLRNRRQWKSSVMVGKTLVSSSMIDRVVRSNDRKLMEVPVGFKWFAQGLLDGNICFGGEESAGASFLRMDGSAWTTDKDGMLLDMLAAEITAVTGKDPGEHYSSLAGRFGEPFYTRIDAPATPEEKAKLKTLDSTRVAARELAGEPIVAALTRAPGNNEPIGGLKVLTENGWFAARPSGTENIYKIYAESFKSKEHLDEIVVEARKLVSATIA
jgi:phosphoglucomutase